MRGKVASWLWGDGRPWASVRSWRPAERHGAAACDGVSVLLGRSIVSSLHSADDAAAESDLDKRL